MRGSWLVIPLLFGLASPALAETKTYGLGEVLSRIRERSPALLAARSKIDIADAQVDQAWTGWKPNLSAIGQVTLNNREAVLDFTETEPGAPPIPDSIKMFFPPRTVLQPQLQLAAILKVEQTLFNITLLRAPAAARAARAVAVAEVDAVEDDLVFSGATLYVALVGLKGLEEAAERAFQIAEKRILEAKIYVEAGTETPLAVTRAETDRAKALGERISVKAQRQRLLSQLGLLLGEDGVIEVRGDAVQPFLKGSAEDPLGRSSVVAAEKKVEAAQKQVGLHDMSWLPTVSAEGLMLYQNFDGFAGSPFLAQAVVSLVIPLYDRGERYTATRLARTQVEATQRGLDLERRSAKAFLASAQADLLAAQAELDQATAQSRLAEASVQQAEDLASGGLATALELADVDARRFSADRLTVQKQLALELARLRLHYAAGGQLTAD